MDLHRRVAYLPETKTGEARTVPLSTRAVRALQRLAWQKAQKKTRKKGAPPSAKARASARGAVFSYTRDGFRAVWSRLLQRARQRYEADCARRGIEPDPGILRNLRFHDLRHEATSRLFELGLNPMEVASITGHKTLQMLKRYTHLRAEDLAKKLG